MTIRRRPLLGALALSPLGCECNEPPPPPSPDAWEDLHFAPDASYDRPGMATVRPHPQAPILIALHGRGEARGLEIGARGWRDDYHLERAYQRIGAPPLTREDFLGFVRDERLAEINDALKAQPFRGLTLACPYAPALSDRSALGAVPYGRFLIRTLLPRVRAGNERAGIDGVSMGGRLALLIGLSAPDVFHSVGALQPAISPDESGWLADMAAAAQERGLRHLRLVSSDDDPFLGAVTALSDTLRARHIDHQLVVTPGPHDYAWNRGPGAYELLFGHERALYET